MRKATLAGPYAWCMRCAALGPCAARPRFAGGAPRAELLAPPAPHPPPAPLQEAARFPIEGDGNPDMQLWTAPCATDPAGNLWVAVSEVPRDSAARVADIPPDTTCEVGGLAPLAALPCRLPRPAACPAPACRATPAPHACPAHPLRRSACTPPAGRWRRRLAPAATAPASCRAPLTWTSAAPARSTSQASEPGLHLAGWGPPALHCVLCCAGGRRFTQLPLSQAGAAPTSRRTDARCRRPALPLPLQTIRTSACR